MPTNPLTPLTRDQSVRLAVVAIREAIKRGPDKTGASTTERIMIAFATCDRQLWLPRSTATAPDLWQSLDDRQRDAIALYLNPV